MTKKIYILFLVIAAGVISSCSDYLDSDQYFKDRRTIERTFQNPNYTEQWLAHVFREFVDINADVASKGRTPHCFADDMFYGDRDREYDERKIELSYNMFKMGEYNENEKQGTWEMCYRGIRNASTFIENIHMMKSEWSDNRIEDYRGQARFARAYLYWLLLRKYGPIPLLPNEGIDYTKSYDEIATPRSTYEECAQYIADEMQQAAIEMAAWEGMKRSRGTDASARPTCGAALATRAKALLYAASPIANGNTQPWASRVVDDEGKRLLSDQYDGRKWAKAAAAARDVMELGLYELHTVSAQSTGGPLDAIPATITPFNDNNFSTKAWPDGYADIDPLESYRQVFNGELVASGNSELIFTRGNNGGEGIVDMVFHQLPRASGGAGGFNTHGLTQKMVDAYYMRDGKDVDGKDIELRKHHGLTDRGNDRPRETGYIERADVTSGLYSPLIMGDSKQYALREPRFYASVAYSGSLWNLLKSDPQISSGDGQNINLRVHYYRGEKDGYDAGGAYWLRTGYGIKKFVHPGDTYPNEGDVSKIVPKPETAIRYADILLMYAEALNELKGESYTIPKWNGGEYSISRSEAEMKRGIHPVRIRAGIPDYPQSVYDNYAEMKERLVRERMIELMGEGQRYYDLRRWLIADVEEALPIYGCNVLMTKAQRDLFHQPVAVWALRTTFSEKMWFWPISHEELKRNKRLTQNPGWTYND